MDRARIKSVLPWVVATTLMGHLFYTIPLDELLEALRQTRVACLLATVFFVDMGSLLADSYATSRVFSWFLVPVGFWELLPVRAATYLMAILNYNLGQAGLVYYAHRVKGASVMAATGLILMMMGTVMLLLTVLSAGGVLLSTDSHTRQYGLLMASLGVGAAAYFVVIRVRPAWLTRLTLFEPMLRAGVSGHLKASAVRMPHMAVIMLSHIFGMRCFGIEVPLAAGLIFIPIVLLVAALPVTPFGLGTMQMSAVHFFAPYSRGATLEARKAVVFAYSLSLATLALLLQALMGLACLKRVSDLIAKPENEQ